MKLLIGLGNPGKAYARNRHNIGFMAIEEIARSFSVDQWRQRFQAEVSEGIIGGEKCLLVKPQTFMNLSGHAAQAAAQFYKVDLGDVIVFHDEIDLAPGKFKVKVGGGNAGHNGLKSLTAQIGNEYKRVRLGVGRPGNRAEVSDYVLKDFAKADDQWREALISAIARHVELLIEGRDSDYMSIVTQEMQDGAVGSSAHNETDSAVGSKSAGASGRQDNSKLASKPKPQTALSSALKRWLQGDK